MPQMISTSTGLGSIVYHGRWSHVVPFDGSNEVARFEVSRVLKSPVVESLAANYA